MPLCNHQLTLEQVADLKALQARCARVDHNAIPLYLPSLLQRRTLPCNLLYYHQQQLVGFLSLFFFYDEACELTLMVDPMYRRQGIAQRLMATIMPVLQSRECRAIVCPSPKGCNDHWLPDRGFSCQRSEVQMQWSGRRIGPSDDRIKVVLTDEDIPALTALDVACFQTDPIEMVARFQSLLRDPDYTLLLMEDEHHRAIGKAHLHDELEHVQLSDIAILPSEQGRGLGRALVLHCLHQAKTLTSHPICLDVAPTNERAFSLYVKCGFKVTNAYDFWTAPIAALILQRWHRGAV